MLPARSPASPIRKGAEASWSHGRVTLAASNGFTGSYESSSHSVGVAVVAGEGLAMERDYDFSSTVYGADLDDPAEIGRKAAERAVRRLGARKAGKTGKVPVVYDPRISGSLLRHLAGAINGILRGPRHLLSEGQAGRAALFAPGITVVDDPHRPRGLRSKPFDGEGVANEAPREIVSRRPARQPGFSTWPRARQLGLESNGRASRGTSSPPGPATTNLYLEPGDITPEVS